MLILLFRICRMYQDQTASITFTRQHKSLLLAMKHDNLSRLKLGSHLNIKELHRNINDVRISYLVESDEKIQLLQIYKKTGTKVPMLKALNMPFCKTFLPFCIHVGIKLAWTNFLMSRSPSKVKDA